MENFGSSAEQQDYKIIKSQPKNTNNYGENEWQSNTFMKFQLLSKNQLYKIKIKQIKQIQWDSQFYNKQTNNKKNKII